MLKRVSFAAVLVLFTSGLLAQNRMMSGGHAPVGAGHGISPSTHRTSVSVGFGAGFHRLGFGRSGFNGPYLYPGYYPGYFPDSYYDSYENEPPPPAPAPAPVPAPQAKQEPLPSPALLELQGNRWVRVDSFTIDTWQPEVASEAAAAKEMPPTVLVYRDGHTEELTSYSIIGTSIYAKSDYWSNGAWTRTIQIADLDLPNTLKQNQQRGVKFELPSGPNEVMIRP